MHLAIAIPPSAALAATLLALSLGCATPVEVSYDASEDFSRLRTWDWIEGDAIVIHAPFEDEARVAAMLARSIERELAPRGLMHVSGHGQVRIGAIFSAVRDHEYFERMGAVATLHSFHDSPSFETQAVHTEVRVVDRCRVALYMSHARSGRLIWQSELQDRFPGGCRDQLHAAVAQLVEGFPPPPPDPTRPASTLTASGAAD